MDKLIRNRRAQRGQVTKLLTRAEAILQERRPSQDGLDTLAGITENLQGKIDLIRSIDAQITDELEEENYVTELVEADDYFLETNERLIRIRRFLERAGDNSSVKDTSLHTSSLSSTSYIKLPTLSLIKFDGDILNWLSFRDSFESAVVSNHALSDVQKFQYLKSNLIGEPAQLISGLTLNSANFSHAMELLDERYGQTNKIISAHMRALWDLASPTDTPFSLRTFSDELESLIRGLKTLGKTEDTYGDLLVPMILDKLPTSTKRQMSRYQRSTDYTLNTLRDALQREIEILQVGDTYPDTSQRGERATASAFYTKTQSKINKFDVNKPCIYCKGKHNAINCEIVKDPSKRYAIVKENKLCFNCLSSTHRAKDCRSTRRCRKCERKHHTSLCQPHSKSATQVDTKMSDSDRDENDVKSIAHANFTTSRSRQAVLLKTAATKVLSKTKILNAYILFDEGSSRSFITSDLTQKLQLQPIRKEFINLAVFGEAETTSQIYDVVSFELLTKDNSRETIEAVVVPQISTRMTDLLTHDVRNLPHLRGLDLAHPHLSLSEFTVSILIGADQFWQLVGDHIVKGNGPTAIKSKLGYLLSGPCYTSNSSNYYERGFHINAYEDVDKALWDLETLGIRDPSSEPKQYSDLETFTSDFIEKRKRNYYAKLPWKPDHPPLPSNYESVARRTRSTIRKMSDATKQAYNRILAEQERNEFIERVSDDNVSSGHYLPHHPVKKDSLTTPIRIVYDCSFKENVDSPSLNDCLEKGPQLLNEMVGILLRFRIWCYAITSDIEKAFLNIKLHENDREFTKFLWLSRLNDAESEFITYQFSSVLFGSISSPAILNAVVKILLDSYDTKVANKLREDIYVDNVVSGSHSPSEAIEFYHAANKIIENGGFKLRSWASNCEELRDSAEQDGVLYPNSTISVLGLKWDTLSDTIGYRENPTPENEKIPNSTKRMIVKEVAKIYDPLGFLYPVHCKAKMFIQTLWKMEIDWDEPLPKELESEWMSIRKELKNSTQINIPRRCVPNNATQPQTLHCFVDASPKAYGAAIYLCQPSGSALIFSKSRVSPLKETSLPRLELMAAVLGARLMTFIHTHLQNLQITSRILWSDSQIVLAWIHSSKHLPTFVRNRVQEIRHHSFDEHKYVFTKENPADLLTRGIKSEQLQNSELWWKGPQWLTEGDWPIDQIFECNTDVEVQSEKCNSVDFTNTVQSTGFSNLGITSIIEVKNFSSLQRLTRVAAYVLRFIKNTQNPGTKTVGELNAEELHMANERLIKAVQQECFQREIQELQVKQNKISPPLVKQLKLFVDNKDFLRCGGRLHNAPIDETTKFPILLPRRHPFTKLIIRDCHEKTNHSGLQSTVTLLRQHFWITSIRQTVKTFLRKCTKCKRVAGQPYQTPLPAPLPASRVNNSSSPFTITGVDFTGELFVKVRNGEQKCYVCLFTCANSRAVHLELVPDLSTTSFLQAMRRFAARRSLPKKMISDNASTYQSAAKEIENLMKNPSVKAYMSNHNIEWTFIPKRAPWYGGFWERLIGLTKLAMRKTLGRSFVTYEELQTILCEIETGLNDRPITYVYSEQSDIGPLTPSHLLHGRQILTMPHADFDENELSEPLFECKRNSLTKRYEHISDLLKQFWRRWTTEYLTALRERHQLSKSRPTVNTVKTGDIVLIHADNKPRLNWDLGKVCDLTTGKDGLIRSVKLKTKNGFTNRPLSKLYPLEISITDDDDHDGASPVPAENVSSLPQIRTKRRTAKAAISEMRRTA